MVVYFDDNFWHPMSRFIQAFTQTGIVFHVGFSFNYVMYFPLSILFFYEKKKRECFLFWFYLEWLFSNAHSFSFLLCSIQLSFDGSAHCFESHPKSEMFLRHLHQINNRRWIWFFIFRWEELGLNGICHMTNSIQAQIKQSLSALESTHSN